MNQSWFDRRLLNALHELSRPATVRMELGAHSEQKPAQYAGIPTIRFKDRRALLALCLNPEMNFGDLYSQGRLEVEGDLVRALETLYAVPERKVARLMSRWLAWVQANTLRGARRHIHYHYDIPADFYGLWLDRQMVYTCAYFPQQSTSLEEAQASKLDLVCRKLWLRRGETVVEAGCGWGALAIHMAKYYGVYVRAFNVSHEQIEFARTRAKREGLSSRVEFVEDDYRNISGHYDAFVSVGMLEHLGPGYYPKFARVVHNSIGNYGRGLLHFIGRNHPQPLSAWIRKRIFPGAYVPVLREVAAALEPYDFSLLDVENLRPHYARTLECWLEAFEHSYDIVTARFGQEFARMWRLYLAGSIAAFRTGWLQLFQVVFAGAKCNSIPWTREHLYKGEQEMQWEIESIRATS
jgi:cyclopropane-fatty-acyl-phospholipid synthase